MDTIKIQIDTNAEQASKSFEDLAKSFNDVGNQAVDLRKEIRAMKTEIFKLTPGTKEYTEALIELGGKMDQLNDIQEDLKASTGGFDTIFQTTTSAIGSMASGFSAAQGVMALFGSESENLQKTFVKLQAVIAISTGIKGFAGFLRESEKASNSLKAFIRNIRASAEAVSSDSKEKNLDAAATNKLSTASKLATTATAGLTKGIKALGAAIAANPIGFIVAGITTLVTVISTYINKQKERLELEKDINEALGQQEGITRSLAEEHEHKLEVLERDITALRLAGASEEELSEMRINAKKQVLEEKEAYLEANRYIREHINYLNQIKLLNQETSQQWVNTMGKRQEFKDYYDSEVEAVIKLRKEVSNDILDTEASKSWFKSWEQTAEAVKKEIQLIIDEGLSTQKDMFVSLNEHAEKEIARLSKALYDRIKLNTAKMTEEEVEIIEREKAAIKRNIKRLEDEVKENNYNIERINAASRKRIREDGQKQIETYEKNYEGLKKAIMYEYNDLLSTVETEVERISKTDIPGIDVVTNIMVKLNDAQNLGLTKEMLKKFSGSIKEAKEQGNISDEQVKELEDVVTDLSKRYDDMLVSFVDNLLKPEDDAYQYLDSIKQIPFSKLTTYLEAFDSKADEFRGKVSGFYDRLTGLKTALDNKEIDPSQYYTAISRVMNDTVDSIEKGFAEIPGLVDEKLASMPDFAQLGSGEQNALKELLIKYLKDSLYIPQSDITEISDEIAESVNAATEAVITQVEDAINAAFTEVQYAKNTALADLQAKESQGPTSFLEILFFEDPVAVGERLRQNIRDLAAIAKNEYDAQIQALETAKKALEDAGLTETDEYKKILDEMTQLTTAYNENVMEAAAQTKESIANEVQSISKLVSGTAGAISNFGSSMQSYYDYMAEYEAKNEKDKQKYTIKGLKMQKLQAISNIASGIVGAIANAFAAFPMPYAAIIAAVESAAVAVAGAAQIKTINKQIQAAGGSSGGSDTPDAGGMVDRVIAANTQNTDQTAQLNAQYTGNAMGMQRVYVTQSDITEAQDINRVAVTNNRF